MIRSHAVMYKLLPIQINKVLLWPSIINKHNRIYKQGLFHELKIEIVPESYLYRDKIEAFLILKKYI